MHDTSKLEFSKITPYIFLGTSMCCQEHFDAKLIKRGIRADISLEYKHIDAPHGTGYFLWLPTKDHKAPSLKILKLGADALDELVKSKIKTYVHCKQGHGRSPTLVTAYFILNGKSWKEAFKFIKSKRPSVHLTKAQVKALRNFGKKFKSKNK